jgi:hypothetical protein
MLEEFYKVAFRKKLYRSLEGAAGRPRHLARRVVPLAICLLQGEPLSEN